MRLVSSAREATSGRGMAAGAAVAASGAGEGAGLAGADFCSPRPARALVAGLPAFCAAVERLRQDPTSSRRMAAPRRAAELRAGLGHDESWIMLPPIIAHGRDFQPNRSRFSPVTAEWVSAVLTAECALNPPSARQAWPPSRKARADCRCVAHIRCAAATSLSLPLGARRGR